jgi:SWI/SNF-related matrix-associated actin-dependent regulator of chromatin subfamily A containing DEAD/H box 1
MMTPFVLRRKKAQVLKDLPQKLERVEWCEMTPLQREVYGEAIMRSKKALLEADKDAIEELGEEEEILDVIEGEEKPKPIKKKRGTASTKTGNKADTSSSTHVLTDLRKVSFPTHSPRHLELSLIAALARQASNHPMLFRRIYDDAKLRNMSRDCLKELEFTDRDKDLIFEDMEVMTDFELHRFCLGYKVSILSLPPSLFSRTDALLPSTAPREVRPQERRVDVGRQD